MHNLKVGTTSIVNIQITIETIWVNEPVKLMWSLTTWCHLANINISIYKHADNDVVSRQNVSSRCLANISIEIGKILCISFDHLALEHNFNPFPMNASLVIYVHWFHFGINFSNSFLIQPLFSNIKLDIGTFLSFMLLFEKVVFRLCNFCSKKCDSKIVMLRWLIRINFPGTSAIRVLLTKFPK